jgi:hypothetical protein
MGTYSWAQIPDIIAEVREVATWRPEVLDFPARWAYDTITRRKPPDLATRREPLVVPEL